MGGDCVFCEVVSGARPEHIVHETAMTIAFMDRLRQPPDVGHVLVIPREHVENIYAVGYQLGAELFAAHALVARALKRALASDGIRTWSSNGPGAGQEVPHFHLHVYSRRSGVPFPLPVMKPEIPLGDDVLGPSADLIRRAIAELG